MRTATPRMQFASAISDRSHGDEAIKQVTDELAAKLTEPVDLAVVFATPHHSQCLSSIREALWEALRPGVTMAATCQGVIGTGREVEEGSGLSVLVATLPGAAINPFRFEHNDWSQMLQSPDALRQRIDPATNDPGAIVIVGDPFSTPQQELMDAFNTTFSGVPIIGGMASGAQQPGANRILINDQIHQDGAVGFTVTGDVKVSTTVSQGCRPIGKPFVITKADGNVVQELGGRNPLQAAQDMIEDLEEHDRHLVTHNPLFVGRVINEYKDRFGRGDFLIRNIVGADQDSGNFAVGDPDLRVGQTIQFHVRDGQTATEDFGLLLEAVRLHGPAAGTLLASCNGRGTHLFDRPNADAEMIQQSLGPIPLAGFFAMGEIGPVGGQTFLHGHTASLLVFHEVV